MLKTERKPPAAIGRRLTPDVQYFLMLLTMAVSTGVCFAVRSRVTPTDVAMVFLLAVVFVASRYGRGPAIVASILAIATFDFVFVPPYYTFDVLDKSYFLTFGVMLLVALSMSRLTTTIREQAQEAQEREARTAALFAMSQELAEAKNRQAIISITTRHVGLAASGQASIALVDDVGTENGDPIWPAEGVFEDLVVRVAAGWAFRNGEAAGYGTRHCAAGEVLVVPLRASSRTIGVVAVQPERPDQPPTEATCKTVQALADQAALALELGTLTGHPAKG